MKRHLTPPKETSETIDRVIEDIDSRLSSDEDTGKVVQEVLVDLFDEHEAYRRYVSGEEVSEMTRMRLMSYDPKNSLTESEHWAEQNLSEVRESKYIRFLWRGFDLSPLSNNIAFALPFRRMLAEHLFEEVGDGVKLFGRIKIQSGHNIRMGENTVVHNDVLLDDRGELVIGDGVSIADKSHIHTHSHDIVEQSDVTTYRTIVDDNARLGYGAMISSGCRVGENAMVGASTVVSGDVPDHHIAIGSPAKSTGVKPGWEEVARETGPLPDNRDERELEREVPDEVDPVDEFGRDLSPPGTRG